MEVFKKYLKFILILVLSILSISILIYESNGFKLKSNDLLLLSLFLIITIIFDRFTTDKKKSIDNVIFVNFNFSLIYLTNPFIALIYSICYGCMKFFKLKFEKRYIIVLEASRNFISTYVSYVFLFYFLGKSNIIALSPETLLIVLVAFTMSIFIENIIKFLYTYSNNEELPTIKLLLINFIQTLLISLFISPLIIYLYQLSNYSGLIFPIGLIFVISYSFKKNFEKQRELEEFKEMSYRDGLTGVYNRRYLEEYLETITSKEEPIAILMLDIDKFKSVNDNYNHSVGDQVLKHFALILQKCIRSNDVLVRYGGEEFTIILFKLTPEQSKIAAERIRASVEASYAIFDFNGKTTNLKYTTSLGLFYSHAHRGYHIKQALKESDNLLYLSKHAGRNKVTSNI